MGIDEPGTMGDALFSRVQQRVLGLLFGHPDRSFYASEIIRLVGSGTGAVQRELARLTSSGIVTATRIGNQKHYRANRGSAIFEEMQGLVLKTVGLVKPLQHAIARFSKTIKAAFVYGSVAKRKDTAHSDIDIMVIGDRLSYRDIYASLQEAENRLGRRVNPNILSTAEWQRRLAERSPFIVKVMAQPKIFIFGSEQDLV